MKWKIENRIFLEETNSLYSIEVEEIVSSHGEDSLKICLIDKLNA